jgi:hypothetical protein
VYLNEFVGLTKLHCFFKILFIFTVLLCYIDRRLNLIKHCYVEGGCLVVLYKNLNLKKKEERREEEKRSNVVEELLLKS